MSHALSLVAISPEDLDAAGGELYRAVEFQMAPFDENGTWFAKGSRWDWWVIGGRYAGQLLGRDHLLRRELDEDELRVYQQKRGREAWANYLIERKRSPDMARFLYEDMGPDDTQATVIAKYEQRLLTAYAFVKNRHWYEGERMGWFGGTARTECELAARDKGEEYAGKCLHTDRKTGARVVTWDEDYPLWSQRFYRRFVRPLHPDTRVVAVDYHV